MANSIVMLDDLCVGVMKMEWSVQNRVVWRIYSQNAVVFRLPVINENESDRLVKKSSILRPTTHFYV